MAAVTLTDTTSGLDDLNGHATMNVNRPGGPRTLLLAPPSLSSQPAALEKLLASHDRQTTDLQMLDRLRLALVALPESTYDVIMLLSDPSSGSRSEAISLLDRNTLEACIRSMKPGATLKSQDGGYGSVAGPERTEAVLAGLTSANGGMQKPVADTGGAVPLRLGKRAAAGGELKSKTETLTASSQPAVATLPPRNGAPVGVGFSDDLDMDLDDLDEDDLIDEDELLTEEDKKRPIVPRTCLLNTNQSRDVRC